MGTVYCAMDETLHREVAIKVLNTDLNDPTVARRFRAEAVTVARLNHPGIATIYELLQHDGQSLMVMEFLRGETLEALVSRTGPLPIERAADFVMQALAALAHAHGLGVVHRDLKPANLMLSDNGIVKIMDFGIARVAGGEQLTSAGFMMGTPAYMAPEQVLGQEIDARTDLYAMGLVLYHLITGKLPFAGTTPLQQAQARVQDVPTPVRTARADLPAWVGQVLDVALARAPESRYQTALLFREALRRGLANLPVDTPTTNVVPPELVATAAPSSMPVLTTPATGVAVRKAEVPVTPDTSGAIAETIASPSAARPLPAAAMDAAASEPPSGSRMPVAAIGGVAALVVVAVGVWAWMRLGDTPAAPAATTSAVTSSAPVEAPAPVAPVTTPPPTATTPDSVPSAGTPASPGTAATTPPAAPGATPARGSEVAPPAGAAAPSTASAGARGRSGADPAAPAATAAAGATAGRAAGARGAAQARGRGAAAETPISFKNVRAFVVSGTKVDEKDAVLRFADGRVAVTDPRGQVGFGSMAYTEITSASHTRAKNPRWYPTLAGPPSNVDMPGGLFRSDRHWLAFQSRTNYLIFRVEDADFRQVMDTANSRLHIKVEPLVTR